MEYVKDNWTGNPNSSHYVWKLSDDERGRLSEILTDFDDYCVKEFIDHFEYLCQCVFHVSEKQGTYKRPSKEARKKDLLDAIKDLKKAQRVVRRIRNWLISPYLPYDTWEQSEYDWSGQLEDSHRLAIGIDKEINQLVDIFKGSPDLSTKHGSPGTIAKSFALKLSDAYMEHIGRPTTTNPVRNPYKGQFYSLVDFAFEIVGLPSEDVSKVVISVCPKRGWKPPRKV